jgi:hypothetical protein
VKLIYPLKYYFIYPVESLLKKQLFVTSDQQSQNHIEHIGLKNEGRYSSYEAVSSHQQDWIIL